MTEHEDRLMDVLLAEVLGDEHCRDLTSDVLARIDPRPKVSKSPRHLILNSTLAAAALIMLSALAWLVFGPGPGYPQPVAVGDYVVEGSGPLKRGSVLTTSTGQAELNLGGYGKVVIEPHSTVKIAGRQKQEAIELRQGRVVCTVESNVGQFTVDTELGIIKVTGTEFSVQLLEGENSMFSKQLVVQVMAGAVLLSGAFGEHAVQAGDKQQIAKVVGVVVAQGELWISIKAEGHKQPVKLVARRAHGDSGKFDPKVIRAIAAATIGSKVKATAIKSHNGWQLAALQVLAAPKKGHDGHATDGKKGHQPKATDKHRPAHPKTDSAKGHHPKATDSPSGSDHPKGTDAVHTNRPVDTITALKNEIEELREANQLQAQLIEKLRAQLKQQSRGK